MTFGKELCRAQIRQAMRESVGKWQAHSLKEAGKLSGLHPRTLYAIASGQNMQPELHLGALLLIPAFGERYMAMQGHACSFVGNESGCHWEAIGSVLQGAGEAGEIVADGKVCNTDKKRLRDRLQIIIRKSVAFIHKFDRDRVAAQVRA